MKSKIKIRIGKSKNHSTKLISKLFRKKGQLIDSHKFSKGKRIIEQKNDA